MGYYRSHWTWASDFDSIQTAVEEWAKVKSAAVPGFVGVWFGQDYDEPEFHFVAVETDDRSAFVPTVAAEIEELTALLSGLQGKSVRYADTEQVSYLGADDVVETAHKGHGDVWFETERQDEAATIVHGWQQHHLANTAGFEKTWLVRGISDRRIHSLAVQFDSKDTLYEAGEAAFDEIVERLSPLLLRPPERRRGGGGIDTEVAA